MKLEEQIKIVKELVDAAKELNGEFQDGWDENIEDGEKLLNYLQSEVKKFRLGAVIRSVCKRCKSKEIKRTPVTYDCYECGCTWQTDL